MFTAFWIPTIDTGFHMTYFFSDPWSLITPGSGDVYVTALEDEIQF